MSALAAIPALLTTAAPAAATAAGTAAAAGATALDFGIGGGVAALPAVMPMVTGAGAAATGIGAAAGGLGLTSLLKAAAPAVASTAASSLMRPKIPSISPSPLPSTPSSVPAAPAAPGTPGAAAGSLVTPAVNNLATRAQTMKSLARGAGFTTSGNAAAALNIGASPKMTTKKQLFGQ